MFEFDIREGGGSVLVNVIMKGVGANKLLTRGEGV